MKPPIAQTVQVSTPQVQQKTTKGTLWPFAKKMIRTFVGIVATVLGLLASFESLQMNIGVDPFASYDSSDPFSERFKITNEGPLTLENVHYVCSVTSLATSDQAGDQIMNDKIFVMVPLREAVSRVGVKNPVSTDCDFLMKLGEKLKWIRVEIAVFYKLPLPFMKEERKATFKFSADKDQDGKFVWTYGSPDRGPFEIRKEKIDKDVIFVPFLGSPKEPFSDMTVAEFTTMEISLWNASQGRRTVSTTILPENVYLH